MKQVKNAYLIGIKGVAMTALAVYLKEKGYKISGSDIPEYFFTDTILRNKRIKVHLGFNPKNISSETDLVIATGAHGGATNPEAVYAKNKGIPFYMHGEYLGKIFNKQYGIAVAGSHGKTTTSSLISFILKKAELSPSYAVGTAYVNGLGPAGHFDKGKYFVAEADEYMTCPATDKTPRFQYLNPRIAVITNIDFDHPDEFNDISEVNRAFIKFSGNIKKNGLLIVCIDDPQIKKIIDRLRATRLITYGFSENADFQIKNITKQKNGIHIDIYNKNVKKYDLLIGLPGKHNMLNALAASIVAGNLGITERIFKKYISVFKGANRRFELIKKIKEVSLYDDYAHHPSEIKATISAIKEWFPDNKLFVIFQPHTFSRTKSLLNEFTKAFTKADKVFITDIFASAREIFDPTINSVSLVSKINKIKENTLYIKDVYELSQYLNQLLPKKAIILTMGAGNLYLWHNNIIKYLKLR